MTTTTSTDAPPGDLGGRLRFHRERAGLSREEVAVQPGTPGFRTLCTFESGARVPSLVQLRELAVIYGVSVVDLLGAEDHAPSGMTYADPASAPRRVAVGGWGTTRSESPGGAAP